MSAVSPLPPVPSGLSANPTVVDVWTIAITVVAAVTLIVALVQWRRTGSAQMLLLAIAGGTMCLFEPALDSLAAVWFAQHGSHDAFTLYGRGIPYWVPPLYVGFFGIGANLTIALLRRTPTRRRVWQLFGLFMLGNVILEIPLLNVDHIYVYYANQPLRVARFPLWMPPVNAFITLLTAVAVIRSDTMLRGARQLLIIPLALTCSAVGNTAPGWPSWLVIDSHPGAAVTQIGGLVTFAFAFWFVSILAGLIEPRPAPAVRGSARDAVAVALPDRAVSPV